MGIQWWLCRRCAPSPTPQQPDSTFNLTIRNFYTTFSTENRKVDSDMNFKELKIGEKVAKTFRYRQIATSQSYNTKLLCSNHVRKETIKTRRYRFSSFVPNRKRVFRTSFFLLHKFSPKKIKNTNLDLKNLRENQLEQNNQWDKACLY